MSQTTFANWQRTHQKLGKVQQELLNFEMKPARIKEINKALDSITQILAVLESKKPKQKDWN